MLLMTRMIRVTLDTVDGSQTNAEIQLVGEVFGEQIEQASDQIH